MSRHALVHSANGRLLVSARLWSNLSVSSLGGLLLKMAAHVCRCATWCKSWRLAKARTPPRWLQSIRWLTRLIWLSKQQSCLNAACGLLGSSLDSMKTSAPRERVKTLIRDSRKTVKLSVRAFS